MEIAIIGKEDFCLGFRLTGIKKIFQGDNAQKLLEESKTDESIGVVVLDETLYEQLDAYDKEALENSLKPIYISLSTKASEDSLKKMIKKSIGIEL